MITKEKTTGFLFNNGSICEIVHFSIISVHLNDLQLNLDRWEGRCQLNYYFREEVGGMISKFSQACIFDCLIQWQFHTNITLFSSPAPVTLTWIWCDTINTCSILSTVTKLCPWSLTLLGKYVISRITVVNI